MKKALSPRKLVRVGILTTILLILKTAADLCCKCLDDVAMDVLYMTGNDHALEEADPLELAEIKRRMKHIILNLPYTCQVSCVIMKVEVYGMQMNRLFQIVYYLLENGKSSAPELAEKFEVSTRTIYRDLNTISAAGIPIYATQGKGGGISLMGNYVLDKSIFSEKEQEQILIALRGIASTEGENADELLSKLSALFQIKWTDWIEVDFSDWNKNKAEQIFGEIKKAIFDRSIVTFSYFSSNGQYLSRSVKPLKLIFKGNDWYLYGFCLLRNDYRFFKLTRIKDLVISAETFIRDVSDLPKDKMEMPYYNTVSVTLKFSPQVAFRVYDEFAESITTDQENNLYVTADLPDHEVLYHYLLTFGDNVEVISPSHIRAGIKEKVCSILKKYET